jgi:hypothetical protein
MTSLPLEPFYHPLNTFRTSSQDGALGESVPLVPTGTPNSASDPAPNSTDIRGAKCVIIMCTMVVITPFVVLLVWWLIMMILDLCLKKLI